MKRLVVEYEQHVLCTVYPRKFESMLTLEITSNSFILCFIIFIIPLLGCGIFVYKADIVKEMENLVTKIPRSCNQMTPD